MPKKLTQEEYEARVFACVGDKYKVISQYEGKFKPITLFCNVHNEEFTVSAECFMRGATDIRGKCPYCIEEEKIVRYANNRTEVECAYCGKKFLKANSKLENSKSGLYFCCREHKDMAQRIDSGERFEQLRPDHYGIVNTCYRTAAFRHYENKCACCGYDEEPKILQVHHRDENRNNNALDNLVILCPNCHAKITYKYYTLTEDNQLKPF